MRHLTLVGRGTEPRRKGLESCIDRSVDVWETDLGLRCREPKLTPMDQGKHVEERGSKENGRGSSYIIAGGVGGTKMG